MSHAPTPISIDPTIVRPRLTMGTLIRISLYWLGLSSIFIGLNQILTGRMEAGLLGPDVQKSVGTTLFTLTVAGALIATLVQPTVGTISDYTVSRFGRRKPYIIVGSILDVAFLAGIGLQAIRRERASRRQVYGIYLLSAAGAGNCRVLTFRGSTDS